MKKLCADNKGFVKLGVPKFIIVQKFKLFLLVGSDHPCELGQRMRSVNFFK